MYQARRVPFSNKENYNDKRTSRAREKVKIRRLSRQRDFTSNRNIAIDLVQEVVLESKEPEKPSRHEQLLKWKQEKELLKIQEKEKKAKEKPPFKCGLVHHKPPPILDTGCRRSSRLKDMQNSVKNVKVPSSKPITAAERKRNMMKLSVGKPSQSFVPASHRFKPPSNLPKIEEHSISQASNATDWNSTLSMSFPAQLSPWISKGRGSDCGKKLSPSCQEKNESPRSSKKTILPRRVVNLSKDTSDDLRKFVGKRLLEKSLMTPEKLEESFKTQEKLGEEEKVALPSTITPSLTEQDAISLENFRSLYEGEISRLDGLCSQWNSLLSSETCQEIPAEAQENIYSTVGQTKLLMREKLAQFNDLLNNFQQKNSNTSPVITCGDLQGFWDLVCIQVKDVDSKFVHLDALKWNNWVGEEGPKQVPEKAVVQQRNINSNVPKTKKRAAGNSKFRAYIAEQRKRIEEAKENAAEVKVIIENTEEGNTREIIASPQRTPMSVLKRRSSQRLSCRKRFYQKGDSVTPKRSSRRVTFADTTPVKSIGKPKVCNQLTPHIRSSRGDSISHAELTVNSPNFAAASEDLISWESPTKDFLHAARRKSPRFSRNPEDSFL